MTLSSRPFPAVSFMEHSFLLAPHHSQADIQCLATAKGLVTSDQRKEWLQARRLGITASGFGELVKRDGTPSSSREKVLTAKVTGVDTRSAPSKYQRLGNEYEPIIAERIQDKFGIEPNQLLMAHGATPRFLATPDGISEKRVGEYKTSIKSWGHNVHEYYRQVQWQLFVADRGQAVFAVMHPHTKKMMVGIVPRDEEEINLLKAVAVKALSEMEELHLTLG